MTRKTITVTRKDIWGGSPRSNHGCAIATCLRRLFPQHLITVWNTKVEVGRYTAVLPTKVMDFTFWYDDHPWLRYFSRPFTFSLEFYDTRPTFNGRQVDFLEDRYYNSELDEREVF